MHAERIAPPEECFEPVAWQKWKFLAYVALLGVAIASGAGYVGPYPIAVKALIAIFGALQFIGIFSLMHESSHGHLARDRRVNRFLGEMLSVIVGTSYPGYRLAHLGHHASFRTEDDPQEIIYPRRSRAAVSALLLIASVIGAPVFLLVRVPLLALRKQGIFAAIRGPLLAAAFYTGLSFVLPVAEWNFLVVVVLSALLIGSMNDIVYHQGLAPDDSLAACSSFDCDIFGQLFLSGANRHAEHHVYPGVPGPRLVQVSRLVRQDLIAHGAEYDRGFTIAFIRRFVACPYFQPRPMQLRNAADFTQAKA